MSLVVVKEFKLDRAVKYLRSVMEKNVSAKILKRDLVHHLLAKVLVSQQIGLTSHLVRNRVVLVLRRVLETSHHSKPTALIH